MNGRGCDVIARTYHFLDARITPAPASPPTTPHARNVLYLSGVCVPRAPPSRARARATVAYNFRWHIVLLVYYKRARDTLSCS